MSPAVNPFGDLYKLLSIGLHHRTDDECGEIVGAMDDSLKFIYTQLTTHMEASAVSRRRPQARQDSGPGVSRV